MTITIDIVNQTSRIRDARFAALVPVLQQHINADFGPAWQLDSVTLNFVGRGQPYSAASWSLFLRDTSDEPGDLGYHTDAGQPAGYVFVEDDMRYGAEISVTIDHELKEMLVDPTTARMGATIGGNQYICEVCDPVEADADGFVLDGFHLSNFVLPAYFDPSSTGPWDFMKLLSGPCPALRPGGYLMWFDGISWKNTMARYADGSLSHRAIRPFGRQWRRASL